MMSPFSAKDWKSKFDTLEKDENWDELEKQATDAIALNPNETLAFYYRGKARKELGRAKEATIDFNEAIRLDDTHADFYFHRAEAKMALDLHKNAIKDYDEAIKRQPDDAAAYYLRAKAKQKGGRYADAVDDYDAAIEEALKYDKGAKHVEYHYNRAIAIGMDEAKKSSAVITEQLENITKPGQIIKNFDKEIIETWFRLYGKNLHLLATEDKALLEQLDLQKKDLGDGWIKQAEKTTKTSRIILCFIAIVASAAFYGIHKDPKSLAIEGVNFLDILQLTTFTILLYYPFLLFNRHLTRRADQEVTRLHALMRDRDRLLFWTAQTNDLEETNKSRLARFVLESIEKNSTADISMRIMQSNLLKGKEPQPAMVPSYYERGSKYEELLAAIKNLTLNKSE